MRLPRIPAQRFNVRADDCTDTRIRRARVECPDRPVVAPREEHGRLGLVPLYSLHLILVHIKAPQRALALASVPIYCRVAVQIPKLHRPVRARARKEIAVRAIPREAEHGVDVVRGARGARLRLLALLLARPQGRWDVCGSLVRPSEDHVWVHRLDGVERPNLDLGLERAYSDEVAELLRCFGRGCGGGILRIAAGGGGDGGEVEPFEAKGEGGEHEVVVRVEVLFGFFVDVDLELGYLVFGLGDNQEIVAGENLELFALLLLLVFFECDERVFVVIAVICEAFDVAERTHACHEVQLAGNKTWRELEDGFVHRVQTQRSKAVRLLKTYQACLHHRHNHRGYTARGHLHYPWALPRILVPHLDP